MRIAINCRSFLNKDYTGIGRYSHQMVLSLAQIDQVNDYLLYMPKRIFSLRRKIPRSPGKNFKLKIDRFYRNIERTTGPFDVYHAPSPEDIQVHSSNIVVTVHDLIFKTFPGVHSNETIATAEKQLAAIVQQAKRIICCSQSTLKDLVTYFSVKPDQATLIYPGVDKNDFYRIGEREEPLAQAVLKSRGVVGPFLLFVGTVEPRKNIENVIRAFGWLKDKKKFSGQLVLIGGKGWDSDRINQLIDQFNLRSEILILGFVSNQELRYFYNKAKAFVFPSFYEGFGFPIVEAFNCGTPVVTSNVSSCAEIAGEAALQVDPKQFEELALAIDRILHEPGLDQQLQMKGLKRAGDFSFLSTARQTLDVYQDVYRYADR